jgi:hypothetical protein
MRGTLSAILCMLGLPILVRSDLPTLLPSELAGLLPSGLGGLKGEDPVAASTTATAAIVSPSASSTTLPQAATTTKTIEVSSFVTSSSVLSSSPIPTSSAIPSLRASSLSMSTTSSAMSEQSSSTHHRTLVIVLSTVLGFVGLALIAAAAFLTYRYCGGQYRFGRRGASPINDDEIASWRRNAQDQKQRIPSLDPMPSTREVTPIALTHSPGWTWTASPTSIRTISAVIPDTPSFLAKAPNSRAGLTDEAIPGADPFIATVKRQSSRLSKAPPGHTRTKSRRSSTSGKSVWSFNGRDRISTDMKAKDRHPTWYDPEDGAGNNHIKDLDFSTPGTSEFDSLSTGGLSPRPKSRSKPWELELDEKEIGRAIA